MYVMQFIVPVLNGQVHVNITAIFTVQCTYISYIKILNKEPVKVDHFH